MMPKILIVDDEEGIRKVLDIALTDCGYRVFVAANAREALGVFRRENPLIVLTDIKMQGMDGIELLRRIKSENADTEVIMITGHGDMDLAVQSLKLDAADFITKPISNETLEIALKRAEKKIFLTSKLKEYTENLEKLVEEKTARLIEAERLAAVGQTVAGLAHAIKNIASGLTGGGFVLEKGLELENKKYLIQGWDLIKGNVERIKSIAMDLLNYSKDRRPDYRLCDPNKPARDVYDLLLPKAREEGVRLEARLDAGLPHAYVDPEGIHRCLLNLVTNAIDACTDFRCTHRSGEVIIETSRPQGWAVEYGVRDNGCGMDRETRQKVFQSFFSTKGSRGTGLGLMISKKIIDEHRGEMEFTSKEGRGSAFFMRLPRKADGEK